MANLIKILPSGAELDITMASFEVSHNLFKVFMREVGGIDLTPENFQISLVKELMRKIPGSEELNRALWPCMEMATYKKVKVNKDLFDNEQAREEFVLIAKEVLVYNLTPFFKNLGLAFSQDQIATTSTQK